MKNKSRTTCNKLLSIIAKSTLCVLIFALVFASVLSISFNVDDAQQSGINSNIASAAAGQAESSLINLGSYITTKSGTTTFMLTEDDIAKRGRAWTTNEDHTTNGVWTTEKWQLGSGNGNFHSGTDFAVVWFDFDLGPYWTQYYDIDLEFNAKIFAFESGYYRIGMHSSSTAFDQYTNSQIGNVYDNKNNDGSSIPECTVNIEGEKVGYELSSYNSNTGFRLTSVDRYIRLYYGSADAGLDYDYVAITDLGFEINVQTKNEPFAGTGTDTDPYTLKNRADFDRLSNLVRWNYPTKNTYFSVEPDSGDTISFGSTAFVPIGGIDSYDNTKSTTTLRFMGIIDGNNNIIDGLNITRTTYYNGLFGYTYGATIKNLTIDSPYVDDSTSTSNAAFVGRNENGGVFDNCHVTGTGAIKGTHQNGGIIGYAEGDNVFTNCSVGSGITITSTAYKTSGQYWIGAGGLVGSLGDGSSLTMTDCINNATVTGEATTNKNDKATNPRGVGGLVGYVGGSATITNCSNTGDVTGAAAVGGIVGYAPSTTITGCSNSGRINTNREDSDGSGTVTIGGNQGAYIGGIVGYATGDISNCYNEGDVGYESTFSYNNFNGGIAGYATGNISHCYSTGTTYVGDYGGGIVGKGTSDINYCYVASTINCVWNNTGANYGYISGDSSSRFNTSWRLLSANFVGSNVSGSSANRKDNSLYLYSQYANNVSGQELVPVNSDYEEVEWSQITEYDIEAFRVQSTIAPNYYMHSGYRTSSANGSSFIKPIHIYSTHNGNGSMTVSAMYDADCLVNISSAIALHIDRSTIAVGTIPELTYSGQDQTDAIPFTYPSIPSNDDIYYGGFTQSIPTTATELTVFPLTNANVSGYSLYSMVRIVDKDGNRVVVGVQNTTTTIAIQKCEMPVTGFTFTSGFAVGSTTSIFNNIEQGIASIKLTRNGVEEEIFYKDFETRGIQQLAGSTARSTNIGNFTFAINGEDENFIITGTTSINWSITPFVFGNNNDKNAMGMMGGVANSTATTLGNYTYYPLNSATGETKRVLVYYPGLNGNLGVYMQDGNGDWVKLVENTHYTITALQPSGEVAHDQAVTITAKADGNYSGSITTYATLMMSDFGANGDRNTSWGSERNPYIISDWAHLVRLSQIVNGSMDWDSVSGTNNVTSYSDFTGGYFVVTSNISVTGDMGFEPIGTSSRSFKARSFNGGNHTITLTYSNSGKDYVGLFGYADCNETATIKNVNIAGTIWGGKYVGGIAGYLGNNVTLSNVYNTANITASAVVGGIAGKFEGTAIDGASNIANVTTVNNGTDSTLADQGAYVGGIAGYSIGNITNAYSSGTIGYGTVYSYDNYVGGIVGYYNGTSDNYIKYCYSQGTIQAASYLGGIVGMMVNGTMSYCYTAAKLKGLWAGNNNEGWPSIGYMAGHNYSNVSNSWRLIGAGKAGGNLAGDSYIYNNAKYITYGNLVQGQELLPVLADYSVSTWDQIVTNDIDAFRCTLTVYANQYMTTKIDGDGSTSDSSRVDATPINVSSTINSDSTVSILVDFNANCASSGTFVRVAQHNIVKSTTSLEYNGISRNNDIAFTTPLVPGSMYSVDIVDSTGAHYDIINVATHNIYPVVRILDKDGQYVAVGKCSTAMTVQITPVNIANAYADGKLKFGINGSLANGIVGPTDYVTDASIDTYYTLDTTQLDNNATLVYAGANIRNSYVMWWQNGLGTWLKLADSEFSVTLPTTTDGAPTQATVTLNGAINYTGSVSKYFTLMDSDFGTLKDRGNTWGTISNPYIISSKYHLLRLSQIVNGATAWDSLSETNDTTRTYAGKYFALTEDITIDTDFGFTPIGDSQTRYFAGTFGGAISNSASTAFNGGNIVYGYSGEGTTTYKITYQVTATRDYAGLFGAINGATIKYLSVKVDLLSASTYDYVGGLVGYACDSTIQRVYVEISANNAVDGENYVGGLVGYAIGTDTDTFLIDRCNVNTGNVTGADYVGGIMGYAENVQLVAKKVQSGKEVIDDAFLEVAIVTGNTYVGGIAGYWIVKDAEQINESISRLWDGSEVVDRNGTVITYSSAITIYGDAFVGGIAGYFDASAVPGLTMNAYLKNASVNGRSFVGGLYGVYIGGGYRSNSATASAKDSVIHIDNTQIKSVVSTAYDTNYGNVMGALFGYVAKTGIIVDSNITSAIVSTNTINDTSTYNFIPNEYTNFVGLIAGIIGENATIENLTQTDASGNMVVGSNPASITVGENLVANNYVGGIAGYVTSTAGAYYETNWTVFGNKILLINNAIIQGRNNVGGLFGSIGKVADSFAYAEDVGEDGIFESSSIASAYLLPILQHSSQNIITFGNIDDKGHGYGRAINTSKVQGVDYVGGLVGSVTNNAQVKFENTATSNSASIYSDFAIYNGNKSGETNISIIGNRYVGGLVGYLSNRNNSIKHVISEAVVIGGDVANTMVGGLVGEMNGGSIENCVAYSYQTNVSGSTTEYEFNGYQGRENVGGIVGYLVGGSVSNSISTGLKYSSAASVVTIGGVIGNTGVAASVMGVSAVVVVPQSGSGATGTTDGVEPYELSLVNNIGNVILVDERLVKSTLPNVVEMAITVGICTDQEYDGGNASRINTAEGSDSSTNIYNKTGYLSLAVDVPTDNRQLVFYNASGNNVTSTNDFETFTNPDGTLYIRLGVIGENAQSSMAICIKNIEFDLISAYTPSADEDSSNPNAGGNTNVSQKYIEPGNSTLYSASVTGATYDNNNHNITQFNATIYYAIDEVLVEIGSYKSGTLVPGETESTSLVISTQSEWDAFAKDVIAGESNVKFVALATNITVEMKTGFVDDDSNLINGGYNTLGHFDDQSTGFTGTINGNGYKITAKLDDYTITGLSVFPYANGATFKNVEIDGYVNAIKNSLSNGEIKAKDIRHNWNGSAYEYGYHASSNIAAFVGEPMGSLEFINCTNNANIGGFENVAGFIGKNAKTSYSVEFTNCVNTGDIVSTDGSYARGGRGSQEFSYDDGWGAVFEFDDNALGYVGGTGGFVGRFDGTLTANSCRNAGNVTGGHNVGGIVGRHDGKTSSYSTIKIYSCANTGYILSNSGYFNKDEGGLGGEGDDYPSTLGIRQNIWGFAGGLVGKTCEYSVLRMLASYNAGTVTTYSSVSGGLVGCVGMMRQEANGLSIWGNHCFSSAESTIAYCYNVGTVNAGGTYPKHSNDYDIGRENYGGTISGGIAGYAGWIEIDQCYNAGDIYSYGAQGYGGSGWQFRSAGILAEACPYKAKHGTDTHGYVTVSNSYNVGNIIANFYNDVWPVTFLDDKYAIDDLRYGAAIIGYNDSSDVYANVTEDNCYSIKNALVIIEAEDVTGSDGKVTTKNTERRRDSWFYAEGFFGFGDADKAGIKTGTDFDTYSELTALMQSDGSISPTSTTVELTQSIDSITATDANLISSSRPDGWIYVYGCMPQLAVFTVDTPNGLSMRAENAGTEYPFIIKDGVDLLGFSSLVNKGFSFEGYNIEFANSTNNLEGVEAMTINLPTELGSKGDLQGTNAYTSTDSNGDDHVGKSYHLLLKGAMHNQAWTVGTVEKKATQISVDKEYGYWADNNYHYNGEGTSTTMIKGTDISEVNYYPAGRATLGSVSTPNALSITGPTFNGSISGAQSNDLSENTVINNLRVNVGIKGKEATGGLFGVVSGADISNITTNGTIHVHSSTKAWFAYAGGIVGIAFSVNEDSNIKNCSSSVEITSLHGHATEVAKSGAGGIVGYAYARSSNVNIDSCSVTDGLKISSQQQNLGGIVGSAGGTEKVNITNCEVKSAIIQTVNPREGHDIGGIIGTAADVTKLTVDGCHVGESGDVTINGLYNIGGVLGSAHGNAAISNTFVGLNTTITALDGAKQGDETEDLYDYANGVGVGGFVGYTNADNGFALGFSGIIRSLCTIVLENAESKVVGGIIGRMQGVQFINKVDDIAHPYPEVVSTATIKFKDGVVGAGSDIGGVAGYTSGANFTGTFIVSPTLSVGNSQNIGGFIGTNGGESAILAHKATSGQDPTDENTAEMTYIFVGGAINAQKNIGGFLGHNKEGATLLIAPDTNNGVDYGANRVQIMIIGQDQVTNLGTEQNPDNIIIKGTRVCVAGVEESEDVDAPRIANAGGFIGYNDGTLTLTKGDIFINEHAVITSQQLQSDNTTYVISGNNVGGIIGNNNGTLIAGNTTTNATLNVINRGTISGMNNVGGIIGLLAEGDIAGVYTNEGDVIGGYEKTTNDITTYIGGDNVGGIIGNFDRGTLAGNYTNKGNVEGNNYVGGVIGFMSGKATIHGDDTTFTNTVKDSSASPAQDFGVDSGATVAEDTTQDTTDTQDDSNTIDSVGGHVEGHGIGIGGSIGGMFGTISGGEADDLSNAVVFTNNGTIDGYNYIGGSIGILAGDMSYTVFVNDSTTMSVVNEYDNVNLTVGGSVGYVGNPTGVTITKLNENGQEYTPSYLGATIQNTHFEFNGNLQVRGRSAVSGEIADKSGIGGAIGVIDQCVSWGDNTFYIGGNVDATDGGNTTYKNLSNVGGVIGYIGAENIVISNLLTYHAHVQGGKNVGGFVGASFASGTVIANSYNIEGAVSGDSTNTYEVKIREATITRTINLITLGGIIGRPYIATANDGVMIDDTADNKSTNAGTSYWVKGKANSELEYSTIDDINVSSTLTEYIDLEWTNNGVSNKQTLQTTTLLPFYLLESDGTDKTPTTETDRSYIDCGNPATDEQGYTVTPQHKRTITTYEKELTVNGNGKTIKLKSETQYINADTRNKVVYNGTTTYVNTGSTSSTIGPNVTYSIEDAEYTLEDTTQWVTVLGINTYTYVGDFIVEAAGASMSNTGMEDTFATTGWYFVYANDTVLGANIEELHVTSTDESTANTQIDYWKKIVGARTYDKNLGKLVGSALQDTDVSNIIKPVGWCSQSGEHTIDDANVNIIYDDCNPFSVILKDEGDTANLSKHFRENFDDQTIESANTLARAYERIIDNLEWKSVITNAQYEGGFNKTLIPSGLPIPNASIVSWNEYFAQLRQSNIHVTYNSTNTTWGYYQINTNTSYSQYVNIVKSFFDKSNMGTVKDIECNVEQSAIIGLTNTKGITFNSMQYPSHSDLQTVVARLFGYSDVDTFNTYLDSIKTLYINNATTANDYADNKMMYFDGTMYTQNGTYVLPFVFSSDIGKSVLACVFLESNGEMNIWFSNIQDAFEIANVYEANYNSETSSTTINTKVYGRCVLFGENTTNSSNFEKDYFVSQNTIYAKADIGQQDGNIGYYLYAASSIIPESEYDWFTLNYVAKTDSSKAYYYFTAPTDGSMGNIALFYRRLDIAPSIVYNSYERVLPLRNEELNDEDQYFAAIISGDVVNATNAGSYTGNQIDVDLNFNSNTWVMVATDEQYANTFSTPLGLPDANSGVTTWEQYFAQIESEEQDREVVYSTEKGGWGYYIDKTIVCDLNETFSPSWTIAQKEVKIYTTSNGATYGGDSRVNVIVEGIAPRDDRSGGDDNFVLKLDITQSKSSTGAVNETRTFFITHYVSSGSQSDALYYVREENDANWTAIKQYTEEDHGGYDIGGYIFIEGQGANAQDTALETSFTKNNAAANAKAKGFDFTIDLDDVSEYTVSFSCQQERNNHIVKANSTTVKVLPATLTINSTSTNTVYDGNSKTALWEIEGWQLNENLNTEYHGESYASILTALASANAQNNSSNESEVVVSQADSTILQMSGMKNVDTYAIEFSDNVFGNYQFLTTGANNGNLSSTKITEGYDITTLYVKLGSWSNSGGSHTYDGSKTANVSRSVSIDTSKTGHSTISLNSTIINEINGVISFSATADNGASWGTKASGFDSNGTAKFVTGVNAGVYTVSTRGSSSTDNISISGTIESTARYTINRKDVTASITVDSNSFTYNTQSQGVITVTLKDLITGDEGEKNNVKVNVTSSNGWALSESASPNDYITSDSGTYTATVVSGNLGQNYKVVNAPSVEWTITPISLVLTTEESTTVQYNGEVWYPTYTITVGDNDVSMGVFGNDGISWAYTITTVNESDETVTCTEMIDAGTYDIKFSNVNILRGDKTTGDNNLSLLENYTMTSDANSGQFIIRPRPITPKVNTVTISGIDTGVQNGNPAKVYDATYSHTIDNTASMTVEFEEDIYPDKNGYSIDKSIVFMDDENYATDVGTHTVVYTITLKDKNFEFSQEDAIDETLMVSTTTGIGYITPATLTVNIDTLYNGAATKEYDGNTAFGGSGFEGQTNGRSEIYYTGNGFTVSGFPTNGEGTTVKIVAEYAETEKDRSAFDSFINNVEGTGVNAYVGTSVHNKKLVFNMTADDVCNYVFVVKCSSDTSSQSTLDNQVIEVYDKDDNDSDTFGNIDINITQLSIKANYLYQSQSYAKPDNTYNTDWKEITGSVKEQVAKDDGLVIDVVNGWLTPGMIIKQYTFIRGREGNSQLSASIKANSNGTHVNYYLINQPFLSIGYFVSSDAFEIGSLASLMIATYYQYMAINKNEPGFNIPSVSETEWMLIATNEQYAGTFNAPTGLPTPDTSVATWDDYFAQLADEGIDVIYSPLNGGWGYYKIDDKTTAQTYTKFKQVANVSGIMTAMDIEMLDNFFTRVDYNADGSIASVTRQDWGVGKTYLNNFFNTSVGNVITVYNSIFATDMGVCTYDGNGYTINHVNIVGYGNEDMNVGMFASADASKISNVHLRNFNITVNGTDSTKTANVGGIIANATGGTLNNSTFHGTISVSGNSKANVGGILGGGNASVDGVIALGSIDVNANGGVVLVGGIAGKANKVSNAVSMMNVLVTKASGVRAAVNAIAGSGSVEVVDNKPTATYLASSAWIKNADSSFVSAGSNSATAKSYGDLYAGSNSGYPNQNYFAEDLRSNTKDYDVIDNVKPLDVASCKFARESMRLRDLIDVYLLMYALEEHTGTILDTTGAGYYTISSTSWLVGNKHGTNSTTDAIEIANQQGVALLRELPFASFKLTSDVEMYKTYQHTAYSGVFYGTLNANGHKIILNGSQALFEKEVTSISGGEVTINI